MKRITVTLAIITFTALSSCSMLQKYMAPKPDHKLRVDNRSNYNLSDISVGAFHYSDLRTKSKSKYYDFKPGNYKVYFNLSSGQNFSGNVQFQGGGKHFWTFVFKEDLTFDLVKDKK